MKKKRLKMMILLLTFLPGVVLVAVGAYLAWSGRAAIQNAEVSRGTVSKIYTRVQQDLSGKVERQRVVVSFVAGGGTESTFEAEVFSTMFVSAGDRVEVRYDARDPRKARLSAGFFAEPYSVVFCILFGAFWLAIPIVITTIVVWPRR